MNEERSHGIRVLHAPTDVGGHPSGLVAAEKALGAQSMLAVLQRSWLGYPVDIDLNLGQTNRWNRLTKRVLFGLKSISRHDVFHFNFGQSFLPRLGSHGIDLPLLRAAGKTVVMTYQGCDARQVGYCQKNFSLSCCGQQQGEGLCHPRDDASKANNISYVSRSAHRVFCLNPDLLHVVPQAEFVPYAAVNPDVVKVVPSEKKAKLKILHAPTNRAVKGTKVIEEAASALEGEFDLEWLFIEGIPHQQAMELYKQADLVIDQLRVGWYWAFAVEMMAMGKPVMCYIRQEDLEYIPEQMRNELPLIQVNPENLLATLRANLRDVEGLRKAGQESRRFVEKWHDPKKIAAAMLRVYSDPSQTFWECWNQVSESELR